MIECSQCGKKIAQFHRVYRGEGYCQTCYQREFKHKSCAKCGNIYRLPRKQPDAICDRCRVDKPCIRCGKEKYDLGKITQYGPVCNSCSVYFREKRACESCGQLSSKLSHTNKNGLGLSLCPSCYSRAKGYQSCPRCGRYRLLQKNENGLMCKKCVEVGDIPCSRCGQDMPAGFGKICQDCYWIGKLAYRLNILKIDIHGKAWQKQLEMFAEWLAQDIGNDKAAMTLLRYLPFFVEASERWTEIPAYSEIILHFKPKKMRQYLKVKQWMEANWHNDVDDSVRVDLAEQDRIKAFEARLEDFPKAKALFGSYQNVLMKKCESGKTKLKSVRLALQPAVGLLEKTGRLPTQTDVDAYLKEKPGQRAAITGFLNHLNREYGLNLKAIAVVNKRQQQGRQKAAMERKLIAYMIKCREKPSTFKQRIWLKMAMPYFHKCALESKSRITQVGDMYRIEQSGQVYNVPLVILYNAVP